MSEWNTLDRYSIRDRFGSVEVFIEWFCEGCPDANLECDEDMGFCPVQTRLGFNGEDAAIETDGSSIRCTRQDAMEQAEKEKYEMRMRGEW